MPRSLAQRQLRIFFLATVIAVAVMVAVSYRNTTSFLEASRWVAHTEEVLSRIATISSLVEHVETSQRGYIITGDPAFRRETQRTLPLIRRELSNLEVLISDNPAQRARLGRLRIAIDAKAHFIEQIITLYDRSGFESARRLTLTGAGSRAMAAIQQVSNEMETAERSLLRERAVRSEREVRSTHVTLAAGALADFTLVGVIFFLVIRDRVQSVRVSNALKEARDAALRSADARGQFLANVSHEIRTPMNAILGMTNLLLASDLPRHQRELAETVNSSAESLLEIINEILDYSKIEAGKVLIESTDFDLRKVVESVVDLFGAAAQAKGLVFGVLFDHELPAVIHGDGTRIRQVLTNLAGNAIKFTSSGDVIIHVNREKPDDGDRVHVRFSVTDSGIGIAGEELSRLFHPFTQADTSTTRRFGGTGLGLAISKQLVEMMGGHLGVDSVAGKGSTFWFVLPFEHALGDVKPPQPASILEGVRVLIVDDNETNRRLIRHNVASWKMVAEESMDGAEALQKLRDAATNGEPFQLVISDALMPQMNGVDLARTVRREPAISGARFVLITSMYERLTQAVMSENGIDACLVKPVKQSVLYNAITDAMAGRTAAQRVEPARAAAEVRPMRNDVRVLVAEDNRVNQMVTTRFLGRLGVRADCVADGAAALEAARSSTYDLIFMDCHMPEMDGFEVTQAIRTAETGGRHTPIVALTASALEGDRERCIAAGMDDYLAKPLRQQQLAEMLDRWLPPAHSGATVDNTAIDRLRRLSSDDRFLSGLVDVFINDAADRVSAIDTALQNRNAAELAEAAHALKSSSGQIGATQVRVLAARLEAIGESGSLDGARAILEQLVNACAAAATALRQTAEPSVTAIVLAAGESTRFGTCKQLAIIDGKPLLQHVLDNLRSSTISDIIVVLGACEREIRDAVDFGAAQVIVNADYKEGISTSIQAGLRVIETNAAMFVLGDQPFVAPRTLDKLADEYRRTRAKAVIPTHDGVRGNPVIIDRSLFAEMMAVRGDVGFRAVLGNHPVTNLAVDDRGVVTDIDTPSAVGHDA